MIDLHFHSTYSDGRLSVSELAELIKKRGLKYCSLTDHNTVAGISELKKCLQGHDVIIIPGMELTALYGENEIHILAYDFDIETVGEILEERNDLVKKQKIEEMQKAIKLFKLEGLKITDNLMPVEKRPVGYTLATDICQHQCNQDIFIKRHGKTLDPENIYFNYQSPGKSCAVKRSGVSVEWLFGRLRGKVADFILAHPFLRVSIVANPLSEEGIFSLLDMGLDGVEIYHDKTSPQQIQWLKKMADERKIHYTGGSDFHGKKNDIGLGFYGQDLEITNFEISNFKLS